MYKIGVFYNATSILLKPYFKGFFCSISNIFHTPNHRGLTLTYVLSHKVLMYIKSKLLKPLQVGGNIKSFYPTEAILQRIVLGYI